MLYHLESDNHQSDFTSLILATLIMQFRQKMAFVMQTTHAQWRQYSDSVDKCLCFPIENVHMYYKITKFQYKSHPFEKIPS